MAKTSEHYNLLKLSEGGGLRQEDAKSIAESLGAEVRLCKSIYIGHWCLYITANQGTHKKLRKEFRVS